MISRKNLYSALNHARAKNLDSICVISCANMCNTLRSVNAIDFKLAQIIFKFMRGVRISQMMNCFPFNEYYEN